MNIMKTIADALGVKIGEEFAVFYRGETCCINSLYRLTHNTFEKSYDKGKTWHKTDGELFLSMCSGNWDVVKLDKKNIRDALHRDDYSYLFKVLKNSNL